MRLRVDQIWCTISPSLSLTDITSMFVRCRTLAPESSACCPLSPLRRRSQWSALHISLVTHSSIAQARAFKDGDGCDSIVVQLDIASLLRPRSQWAAVHLTFLVQSRRAQVKRLGTETATIRLSQRCDVLATKAFASSFIQIFPW